MNKTIPVKHPFYSTKFQAVTFLKKKSKLPAKHTW